ncbi:hypothetical protein SAMN05192561_10441 [Halopenitus malekzadehii]|uniref:Uncharacterized protein n=1 Tax=Halopenitus malekzadehii TaxID=1267564 RepID=A0A1H6IUG1_9EURY|nr:hypothetical protein [Halopenitus malekzadehii]SEH51698.1 hypothetical protein SAMN05192561_10441 [Halopenitus malekzadehii]
MASRIRAALVAVAVLGGASATALVVRAFAPGVASAEAVRVAFGACGVGFVAIALVYAREGRAEQLAGHLLASAGFLVVAVGGGGRIAWLGIVLLVIGGGVLLQDAFLRGGRGGASV